MSLVSASVAVTGAPMFWPDAVFSATLRVVLVPSVKTGAEFVGLPIAVPVTRSLNGSVNEPQVPPS